MKAMPKNWRDLLALGTIGALLAGWYFKLLPQDINSAAVAWIGLILTFYFRKAGGEPPAEAPTGS